MNHNFDHNYYDDDSRDNNGNDNGNDYDDDPAAAVPDAATSTTSKTAILLLLLLLLLLPLLPSFLPTYLPTYLPSYRQLRTPTGEQIAASKTSNERSARRRCSRRHFTSSAYSWGKRNRHRVEFGDTTVVLVVSAGLQNLLLQALYMPRAQLG